MKIGFIGLGTQSKCLAINLANSDHDVMLYGILREPLDEVVAAGARMLDGRIVTRISLTRTTSPGSTKIRRHWPSG